MVWQCSHDLMTLDFEGNDTVTHGEFKEIPIHLGFVEKTCTNLRNKIKREASLFLFILTSLKENLND